MRTTISFFLRLIVAASLLVGPAAGAAGVTPEERWYTLELLGERAGWMRTATSVRSDGALISGSGLLIRLARGPMVVEMRVAQESVETADGDPIEMRVRRELGGAPEEVVWTFDGDTIRIVESQGDRSIERTQPVPEGDWLTPGEAERLIKDSIVRGDDRITYTVLDPSLGVLQPVEATHRRDGEATIRAQGRDIRAQRWIATHSILPDVATIDFVSDEGVTMRSETAMGGLTLAMTLADRDVALSLPGAAPELVATSLVEPSEPIDQPRALRAATYTLSTEGRLPDVPTVGAQRFERIDERSGRVHVDLGVVAPTNDRPSDYLSATLSLDASDERIRALVERAGVEGLPPAERAERLRRFVLETIDEKSLGVGFATASEVARSLEGDCTEHAVLLAAMLRASGVPSRLVGGLVYVEEFLGRRDVFGFHMWTQALLEGVDGASRWVDLDAAISPEAPYDAAHIALGVSGAGAGGEATLMSAVASMLGRLEIDVEPAE